MNRVTFPAMGTEVVAIGPDVSNVADWFAECEQIFSRFVPDSELTEINDSPLEVVEVSRRMAACLTTAAELRERTDGLVDPAVGSAVAGWGYDSTFASVRDRQQPDPVEAIGRWSIAGSTVGRSKDLKLDLGGIAKGWTCDAAVAGGLADVVSAGGDVRSRVPTTVVEIEDPWGDVAARVNLGRAGLATSSTRKRRWRVGGEDAHHIIDPRRMAPAVSPVFSATVVAASAVEAEAGAKAVLLLGERGLAWAEQQDWIDAALVVWHDGNVYATTGWEMAA